MNNRGPVAARLNPWIASRWARFVLLGIAACLSLPSRFAEMPDMGIGASWHLSLQLAVLHGKAFGREFVFTYGPLGYLLFRAPVDKALLLFYDLFVLGSLLSIYRNLLPRRPGLLDALLLIALAAATRTGLSIGAPAVLFTVLCYWLWRVYDQAGALSVAGCLIAGLLLFFGKVNYGMIVVALIPAYGACMLVLRRQRFVTSLLLIFGFPLLVWCGATVWHVDLPNYLRCGFELIDGYSEAMFRYPGEIRYAGKSRIAAACLFFLAICTIAFVGRRRLPWKDQTVILPLVGLAALLMLKNTCVRADETHVAPFFAALPLLLAVWSIGWRNAVTVRTLLLASVLCAIVLSTAKTVLSGGGELADCTPLRYVQQAVGLPWRQNDADLGDSLRARYPEAVFPAEVRSAIGRSSVDVMPWESSVAVLNDLCYQPRPVPQSYSVYTAHLDNLNARFLGSNDAPDYLLYAGSPINSIDDRPAAWDESLTKNSLLENYVFDSEFNLSLPAQAQLDGIGPTTMFVLKHAPKSRRLVPIATTEVSLALDQTLAIPSSTNLVYLTLDVRRSMLGKLKTDVLSPDMLTVTFNYRDGVSRHYRAILPILKSGVLVNRRVESAEEIRNALQAATERNMAVSSIRFTTSSPWAFRTPLKGSLVEYRVDRN